MLDTPLWSGHRRFDAGPSVRRAVLLLHGLGSNADDLIELAPLLASALPDTVFLSPNAPEPCDMAPFGRQWFSLQDWTPQSMWQGARRAAPALEQMINDVRAALTLPMQALALVGFSQGAMMSLHVAPRLPEALGAVVALSGALVGGEHLAEQIISRPPVLLVHGQMDPVVPYAAMPLAADVLQRNRIDVATETRPFMGHNVDNETLARTADFLVNKLG
jgi:phospholipase/carboxylesterase